MVYSKIVPEKYSLGKVTGFSIFQAWPAILDIFRQGLNVSDDRNFVNQFNSTGQHKTQESGVLRLLTSFTHFLQPTVSSVFQRSLNSVLHFCFKVYIMFPHVYRQDFNRQQFGDIFKMACNCRKA